MIPYTDVLKIKTSEQQKMVENHWALIQSYAPYFMVPASKYKVSLRIGKAHLNGAFPLEYNTESKIARYSYDWLLDVLHEYTWNKYELTRGEFKEVMAEYDEDEIMNYIRSVTVRYHKNNTEANRRTLRVLKEVSKKFNSEEFIELKQEYLKIIGE
jgi:hypothetical protein